MIRRRPLVLLPAAALLPLVAGCSTGNANQPAKTVVVTRTAGPTTPTPTKPAPPDAGSGTPGGSTSPNPAATATTRLPGTCDDLLPAAAVDTALGRPLRGQTAFVVGVPEKDIGRLGYLNCRYGLPAGSHPGAAAKAEIGVSLYRTSALAAARIPATVEDYVAHGAGPADAQVGGQPATVLTGATGTGYTEPTLVVASGQRTIAVSVDEAAGANATKDLVALAELALQHSGG